MAYDPCNVVPDTNIPTGLTAHRHHAVHHVVGRIKHSIHHKFPILGPGHPAPTPYGCEKHAILPARPGGNGIAGPATIAPGAKFAALGGAGAGLVALGGLGGFIGGIPGVTTKPKTTTTTTPPGKNPTPPGTTTPPTTTVPPGTPPVAVSEPSTIAVFLAAVAVALLARHLHRGHPSRVTA